MSIYTDLEAMTGVAIHQAVEYGCNYNVIIHNHVDGKFVPGQSTYEMVADSFFNKERPNVVIVHKTDDLLKKEEPAELTHVTGRPVLDMTLMKIDLPVQLYAYDEVLTAVTTKHQPFHKHTSRKHKRRWPRT